MADAFLQEESIASGSQSALPLRMRGGASMVEDIASDGVPVGGEWDYMSHIV